jgi:hypothetical protein
LVRYGLEPLLHRLALSAHAGEFVLKGAMLFTVWTKHPHRATKDLDLLGSGALELARLVGIFGDICETAVDDDGVVFDAKSIAAARPDNAPLALTADFAEDPNKRTQWKAFLRRSQVSDVELALAEVVATIGAFLLPVLRAASASATLGTWPPGGPWLVDHAHE